MYESKHDGLHRFIKMLNEPFVAEKLFDLIPDIVSFVKDEHGRYISANQTLVQRCGLASKDDLLGRTAVAVFPAPLGERILKQDLTVIRRAKPLQAQLERHLYPTGEQGWCLTWKVPIEDSHGQVIGLSGISRDLQSEPRADPDLQALAVVFDYIRENLDGSLRLSDLAALASLSTYQLDQRIRSLFGISAGQYITRARIEAACDRLMRTNDSICCIALDCGYGDQGAFTRQFRKSVGLTPKTYREQMRSSN